MKKLIVLTLTLLLAGMLAAQVLPGNRMEKGMGRHQEMGFHHEMDRQRGDHPMRLMRVFGELELSDKQLSQLEEKRIAWEKETINNRAEIEVKELDARLAAKNLEFDKLKEITSEIFEMKKAHRLQGIDQQKECWNILDKDQQEKAKELLEKPIMRRWENDDDDKEMGFGGQRHRGWKN